MTKRWIEVRYKCRCMSSESIVHVEERGVAEEIIDFMTRVQESLGADHFKRSPLCMSATVEYAKVPVEGDTIGGAAGGSA